MSNADLADFPIETKGIFRPGKASLIAPALVWAFALAILAFVVPKFEAIFRDFGIEMGSLTTVTIWASRSWLVLLGMVVVLHVVDSIVRDALSDGKGRRGAAIAWAGLMMVLPLASLGFVIVTIGATLTGLLLKMSG
jgi:type II secretory pathway component PulF